MATHRELGLFEAERQKAFVDFSPDGRTLLFRGPQSGPAASMIVKDYRFAWRTLRAGDIGVAESYLRGEWETPDLTGFLYLFCINREMMEKVLGGNAIVRWLQVLRHCAPEHVRRAAGRTRATGPGRGHR